ncbi:Radical SAM domain protein [Fervidobacterium nodosum Rt17-B1]|uniref:Radical SAM domain protein n=1 Tax=Fervidobacterium nodosum (strain ATCC 35602 / DSM 5306 / Rt17-B1) TaxID=381764 RepID=A7HJP5_FERNB|nr:Radical SAM domain protein [Fervidobacterium nodosum Rt17-B1]
MVGLFLPITMEEVQRRKWNKLDIIFVTGDAYIDHPSFGVALLGRLLESKGYKVGIIAQPVSVEDIKRLGRPNLFFGVTSGSVDSMVANYTASKKKRKSDDYTPGGINNRRPDRAVIQYVNMIKQAFKDVPIVVGGIEASLRRFAHYDWWSDKVRKSILVDSKADILVYGMGEHAVLEIAKRIETGKNLDGILGTVIWKSELDKLDESFEIVEIPPFEEVSQSKDAYNEMYKKIIHLTDPMKKIKIVQKQDTRYVIQYPPSMPLSSKELDELYLLPYERRVHPFYENLGRVKAIETVRFSITAVRGCFGNCSFCAITHHQGTHVTFRSEESILEEVKILTKMPDFRGTIVDVGGPTANMYGYTCTIREKNGQCLKSCMFPKVCKSIGREDSAIKFINLLQKIKSLPKVNHVFVGSGIRHDLILYSTDAQYIIENLVDYTSGQLKLAPEHAHPNVLKLMHKPSIELFLEFKKRFEEASRRKGQEKYVIGYFIVGHPGEGEKENLYLMEFVKKHLGYIPQQVQIFTPTPGTLSTTMYYTQKDPFTGEKIFVIKDEKTREKFKQRIIFQRRD